MRERGLKYHRGQGSLAHAGSRSREGAWIEMGLQFGWVIAKCRRSREGAWIEIPAYKVHRITDIVAPVRERGLK